MKRIKYLVILLIVLITQISIAQSQEFKNKCRFLNVPIFNSELTNSKTLRTLQLDKEGNLIYLPYVDPNGSIGNFIPYIGATSNININTKTFTTLGAINAGSIITLNKDYSSPDTVFSVIAGSVDTRKFLEFIRTNNSGVINLYQYDEDTTPKVILSASNNGGLDIPGGHVTADSGAFNIFSTYNTLYIGGGIDSSDSKLVFKSNISEDIDTDISSDGEAISLVHLLTPNSSGRLALESQITNLVPFTGANNNVNLGAYTLRSSQLIIDNGGDGCYTGEIGNIDGLFSANANQEIITYNYQSHLYKFGNGSITFNENTNRSVFTATDRTTFIGNDVQFDVIDDVYVHDARVLTEVTGVSQGVDNATTVVLSSATLNSTYPDARTNFVVWCKNITLGALRYEKTASGTWWFSSITVAP